MTQEILVPYKSEFVKLISTFFRTITDISRNTELCFCRAYFDLLQSECKATHFIPDLATALVSSLISHAL